MSHQHLRHTPFMTRREVLTLFAAASATMLAACTLPTTTNGANSNSTVSGGPPPGNPPGGGPGMGGNETLDEFIGITTDGTVLSDLFPIQATGVATEPIITAAAAFLATLDEDQRASMLFIVDDDEWRKWSNVDGYQRQGVSLEEMSEEQRAAATSLLSAALSAQGLATAQNVMKLNTVQGELLNQSNRFNENLYWFTLMGEPSATEPWGFQLDGHHLIINYFVLGDQVVMAPVFLGAEPTIAPEGTSYPGISVLQVEQDQALAFVNTLDATQQAAAILSASKGREDMQAGAFQDNAIVPYAGIPASDLTAAQQSQLLALIGQWVGNLRDEHAARKMDEVEAHLADTYFAWMGDTSADAVFYYRIQSPVILIEFDHQAPGPLGQNPDYAGNEPTRLHIHSIMRTPNGNDYGKDLLRQHYLAYDHVVTPEGVVHVPRQQLTTVG